MHRRDLLAIGPTLGLALPALLGARARAATPAGKPGPDGITRTHALALLGEPALPADFPYWPWVNPDAPKGGELVLAGLGSFDSFNPFILRGTSAIGIGRVWDSLLRSSDDEPETGYAHLAQRIDLPADQMWVAFELNPAAR